jgi:hypothetical protein
MMKLLIIFFLDVQANNLPPTSFSPPSPPILLPYSSEIDEATGAMHKCLTNNVVGCSISRWSFPDIKYEICVREVFWECFFHIKVSEDPITRLANGVCINTNCYSKMRRLSINRRARFVSCILECFKRRYDYNYLILSGVVLESNKEYISIDFIVQ